MHSPKIRDVLFNRRMIICIFTGFSSGLPLYVLYTLVPAWLRTESIDLKVIGLFALIGIPYTWKFAWSPIMDRYVPPFLGRRRGWLLVTQIACLIGIASIGLVDPQKSIWTIAWLAALTAFFSASQDIVLDAYRRELLPDVELGLGNSIHINAYRISGLIPGSLALILADHYAWSTVFTIVASFMLLGIIMTFVISEVSGTPAAPKSLREAIVDPFYEFFNRNGVKSAILILIFMFLFKIGDSMATALSTPFYLDLGFSLTEIGLVAKNAALWPMVIGGIAGGLIMVKIGINRALWLFGLVQVLSILGFVWLSIVGQNILVLAVVIAFEYLGVGLGTAAFVAFIARTTSRKFAATQFALFTALTALPRTFANASTGYIVEDVGWTRFFIFCTLIAIPGMLLLFKVAPWNGEQE